MATIPNERTPRQIDRGISTLLSRSSGFARGLPRECYMPMSTRRWHPLCGDGQSEVAAMSSAQIGSARSAGGGAAKWVFAAIVAVVIVIVAAYFILAGSGGGYAPPSGTYAPATNAPATGAPGTVPPAPKYP